MKLITHVALWLVGLAAIGELVFLGENPIVVALVCASMFLIGVSVFNILEQRMEERYQDLIKSHRYATGEFFGRQIRHIDEIHANRLTSLAEKSGKAQAERDELQAKVHRMTYRPRINGRLAKREDVAQLTSDGTCRQELELLPPA